MKRVLLVTALFTASLSLSACSGRQCLESRTELMRIATYSPVMKGPVMTWVPVQICDKYAKER